MAKFRQIWSHCLVRKIRCRHLPEFSNGNEEDDQDDDDDEDVCVPFFFLNTWKFSRANHHTIDTCTLLHIQHIHIHRRNANACIRRLLRQIPCSGCVPLTYSKISRKNKTNKMVYLISWQILGTVMAIC